MKKIFVIIAVWACLTACKKDAFLAVKPDNSLLVPKTLADFQRVLDADRVMNGSASGLTPGLLMMSEDNYYVPANIYNSSLIQSTKDGYIWADNPYPAQSLDSWNVPYMAIYYSNFVLDGLSSLSATNTGQDWYNAKGSALFYRSHCFYLLAETFSPAYDSSTSRQLPGIPLVLEAEVSQKIERASVQQTYDRILADLKEACNLLPAVQLTYLTRPSKCACFALLARVYQTMRVYDSAAKYADAALALKNSLMDYNNYSSGTYHFPRFAPEVIFHSIVRGGADPYGNIDTILLKSYDSNDLRKTYFFDLSRTFNKFIGAYNGSTALFGGLATDELYLIRAECFARANNVAASLNDLNTLLIKRFRTGKFIPYTAVNAQDVLNKVLQERRKELCFRGLRSTDIRRLNQEGAGITIQHTVNGQTYSLTPGNPKWVWPIPDDIISFNPGMQQNPR